MEDKQLPIQTKQQQQTMPSITIRYYDDAPRQGNVLKNMLRRETFMQNEVFPQEVIVLKVALEEMFDILPESYFQGRGYFTGRISQAKALWDGIAELPHVTRRDFYIQDENQEKEGCFYTDNNHSIIAAPKFMEGEIRQMCRNYWKDILVRDTAEAALAELEAKLNSETEQAAEVQQ